MENKPWTGLLLLQIVCFWTTFGRESSDTSEWHASEKIVAASRQHMLLLTAFGLGVGIKQMGVTENPAKLDYLISSCTQLLNCFVLTGLPETVWAAAVPMNYDRRIEDLVHDIYGDHMYLVRHSRRAATLLFFLPEDSLVFTSEITLVQRNNPEAAPR